MRAVDKDNNVLKVTLRAVFLERSVMKRKSTACKTNKEALRWCKTNKAIIEFSDWRSILDDNVVPEGITCAVFYKIKHEKKTITKRCIDKTLIMAINKMIKDKIESDAKMKKVRSV